MKPHVVGSPYVQITVVSFSEKQDFAQAKHGKKSNLDIVGALQKPLILRILLLASDADQRNKAKGALPSACSAAGSRRTCPHCVACTGAASHFNRRSPLFLQPPQLHRSRHPLQSPPPVGSPAAAACTGVTNDFNRHRLLVLPTQPPTSPPPRT